MKTVQLLLNEFADAWSAKRLDDVVALFDSEGVYFSSVGPGPGRTATGRTEIRALVQTMFAVDQDSVAETSPPLIFGDTAFWTWKYTLPSGDVELGCDLIRVKGGKILLKDAYRKVKNEKDA